MIESVVPHASSLSADDFDRVKSKSSMMFWNYALEFDFARRQFRRPNSRPIAIHCLENRKIASFMQQIGANSRVF
jgi:hypothetical protein